MNETIYRNPVLAWHSELNPEKLPLREPPPGPFTVTRSEVVIRPQGAVVHIWFAAIPAERA